jgi:hypothetical protein
MKFFRPTLNVILFVSIFVAPFWLSIGLLFFGLFAISYYFESVIALFFLELLYYGAMPTHEALFLSAPVIVAILFFSVQGFRHMVSERILRFS